MNSSTVFVLEFCTILIKKKSVRHGSKRKTYDVLFQFSHSFTLSLQMSSKAFTVISLDEYANKFKYQALQCITIHYKSLDLIFLVLKVNHSLMHLITQ